MEANEKFMKKAIEIAQEAAKKGNYPVGAIIVKNNEVISSGETKIKNENDPTAHAELLAVREAPQRLNTHYLENCVLYTTHEPRPMCASAAIWAKMKGGIFGATIEGMKKKPSNQFSWRQIDIKCKEVIGKGIPKLELVGRFMRKECREVQ